MDTAEEWDGRSAGAIDRGQPGASARAEYTRRREADDAHRREVFGRYLAPVVKAFTGERRSTWAWEVGGRGEEMVGGYLNRVVGDHGLVLHDRAQRRSRANIDHIAIVPSGVWVIDTKEYKGRVQQRDLGGWFVSRPALFVNGHNRTNLIPGVLRQASAVKQIVGAGMPVHAVICFADAEWGLMGRPFTIDEVEITWARRLASQLDADGPLRGDDVRKMTEKLAVAFPPYAPSGTSHSPTGA
ncbi:MAG TPA: nuclease-related domain-containing protein [Acidimicrobiales bacterium]|jgi:hypothetical protein|nr:nuclease-related domain-containing protein [Acidimicrobiales bacterium]